MCGIAGGEFKRLTPNLTRAIVRLAMSTLERGRDGFGITVKERRDPPKSLRMVSFDRDRLELFLAQFSEGSYISVVMASRAQPLPEANTEQANLQPYVGRKFALVHNGTISNDREIWSSMIAGKKKGPHPGIDTMVLHALWEQEKKPVFGPLVGGYAVAWIDKYTGRVGIAKNIKTLWMSQRDAADWIFASEPEWLEAAWEASTHGNPSLEHVRPYTRWSRKGGGRSISNSYWASTPELDDKKCVVVTSGGIDSITSAYIAKKHLGLDVTLFHCPHGQLSEKREEKAVWLCAKDLDVEVVVWTQRLLGSLGKSPLTDSGLTLPLGMQSAESTKCWTPGRNMLFLTLAAAYAESIGAKWVVYGNNMEEEATAYGDNDLDFIHYMNQTLRYGTLKGVQLKPVLRRLMKPEILHVGNHLGVPYDKTWSCDRGEAKPCGACGCCTTRRMAFKAARLPDEQSYLEYPETGYPDYAYREFDVEALLKLTE